MTKVEIMPLDPKITSSRRNQNKLKAAEIRWVSPNLGLVKEVDGI